MGLGAPSFGWDFRPRSGTYLMNVYSIVKVLVKGFRPSSGRSRERQKIKPRRKVFKIFFMGPPFKLIWKQRKIKKEKPRNNRTHVNMRVPGFLRPSESRLSLRELGCATCRFEAVLDCLVAGNLCFYLVFLVRHLRFPHLLTKQLPTASFFHLKLPYMATASSMVISPFPTRNAATRI